MTNEQSGPVVLGVDGGQGSAGAMRYAVAEAARTGAELRLVHVGPGYLPMAPMMPSIPSEIVRAGTEILEHARADVEQMAPELHVTTSRRTGSRSASWSTARRTPGCSSWVTRPEAGSTDCSVGTRQRRWQRTRASPVVVVPADWDPPTDPGPVVVGLKSRAHAEELFATAFHRATAHRRRRSMSCMPGSSRTSTSTGSKIRTHGEYWLARGSGVIEEVLAPWREDYPNVPLTIEVVHGDPVHALVHAARSARLLVLVRRAPGRVLGSHLGGTARAVLRAVSCPVEVVPGTNVVPDAPGLELEESGVMLR